MALEFPLVPGLTKMESGGRYADMVFGEFRGGRRPRKNKVGTRLNKYLQCKCRTGGERPTGYNKGIAPVRRTAKGGGPLGEWRKGGNCDVPIRKLRTGGRNYLGQGGL